MKVKHGGTGMTIAMDRSVIRRMIFRKASCGLAVSSLVIEMVAELERMLRWTRPVNVQGTEGILVRHFLKG